MGRSARAGHRHRRRWRGAAVGALGLVVALAVAGCGQADFADRTAVVTLDGASQTYAVTTCGLDGPTVFVVARADDGAVLQAVLGLADDGRTGVPASTGLTVDLATGGTGGRLAAFGAESWARRDGNGPPPGTIGAAALRGSRIQLSGTAVPVGADDRPVAGAGATAVSVDARCDRPADPPPG